MNEFKSYLREIKHNRDYYSRAKIIEMISKKYDELNSVGYEDLLTELIKHFEKDIRTLTELHNDTTKQQDSAAKGELFRQQEEVLKIVNKKILQIKE